METLDDLLPLSPDHNRERLAALKRLFPDLFTNEGRLNVDELKKVVDPALVSETERYDFRWYGKSASKRAAFTPSRAALMREPEGRSVNPQKAGGNMIIEGENLEVLKLLSSAYRERIKCIYIDPPYNTGKDFVYSDRFAEGQMPYWEQTGVLQEGVKVDTNTDSDGRFHSNWLSMMHSRLLVARYLLREDGVIFVSIDDRELVNLERVMSEVFGDENHVATFVRRRRLATGMRDSPISPDHEYVVAYARQLETLKLRGFERRAADFPFNDSKSKYRSTDLTVGMTREMRPNQYYAIKSKLGSGYLPPEDRVWRFEPKSMAREIELENIIWPDESPDSRMSRPRYKTRFTVDDGETNPVSTWIQTRNGNSNADEVSGWNAGLNTEATKELREIFGDQILEYPKPVSLIRDLVFVATQPNDIILDFFGGSGTTAQAVMELNKADGGNRQFILVQLPELTAEDSPAYKAGFKKISDITIERAKRVIARLQKEAENFLPNDPQRQFADRLGFHVFRLGRSVFPRVEFAPDPEKSEAENIDLLRRYIREKEATFHLQFDRENVLDEVLLKNGFLLDYTLTRQPEFTANEVSLVRDAAGKETLLCLDSTLKPETVDHFKTHADQFFIW